MKKLLALSALSLFFLSSSVFAACPCQKLHKVSCDPCEKVKVTCCKPACPDRSFQGQCCHKKSFLQRLWGGTKTAYNNSVGAIYDTMMVPFR